MRPVIRMRRSAALVVATLAMSIGVSTNATAVPSTPDRIAGQIEHVAPEASLKTFARDGDGPITAGGRVRATVPESPSGAVSLSSSKGASVTLGLPDVAAASVRLADDGTAVYDGGSVDVAVQATATGARVLTVLAGAGAPSSYTYSLAEGVVPVINVDGSATLTVPVREGAVVELATIAAPWAKDSKGTPVPTHYEATADGLVQVVEHKGAGVVYPVVADPHVDLNWSNFVLTLSQAEQRILLAGGITGLGGAICAAAAPVCVPAAALLAGGLQWLIDRGSICTGSKPRLRMVAPYTFPIGGAAFGCVK